MPRSKKKFDFEKNLVALEGLVQQLEQGDISLEESLTAFEQGVKLTRECQSALDDAEQRVQILVDSNGQSELMDLPPASDAE